MNYQKIYNQIVERAKQETENRIIKKKAGEYFEGHHIIPKCLGGEGNSKSYNHPNIVILTAREHFLCHWLLHEIHPENKKLFLAFHRMVICKSKTNTGRKNFSSKMYKYLRKQHSHYISGESNGMYGKNHSEESKLKMSKSAAGNKRWLGKTHSQESKNKISSSRLGDKNVMKRPEVVEKVKNKTKQTREQKKLLGIPWNKIVCCPYCNKKGGSNNMSRYHFENCKQKTK